MKPLSPLLVQARIAQKGPSMYGKTFLLSGAAGHSCPQFQRTEAFWKCVSRGHPEPAVAQVDADFSQDPHGVPEDPSHFVLGHREQTDERSLPDEWPDGPLQDPVRRVLPRSEWRWHIDSVPERLLP